MGIKLNPFTGKLDLISKDPDNFSYNYIVDGKTITVPVNQQMLIYEDLNLDGILIVDGEVIILNDKVTSRIVETSTSETINMNIYEVISQTASGITTSLSDMVEGSTITITNRSDGDNTLNLTIQGCVSPTISSLESFSLFYNGTDYDLV